MTKNFKNWLINNGYKLFTANNQPSTVFDYLTGVKYVCQWENKTIEQLADSISEDVMLMVVNTMSVAV